MDLVFAYMDLVSRGKIRAQGPLPAANDRLVFALESGDDERRSRDHTGTVRVDKAGEGACRRRL